MFSGSSFFSSKSSNGEKSGPSFLSRALSSVSLSAGDAGADGGTASPGDEDRDPDPDLGLADILAVGAGLNTAVDAFLLNGLQPDRIEWIVLGQESLLTENFVPLIETDAIFQTMCAAARGVHATTRPAKHETHLTLERTVSPGRPAPVEQVPRVLSGALRGAARLGFGSAASTLTPSPPELTIPSEGAVKQLSTQLRSVADLLADDQALYLQEQQARSGVSFDDRVQDILGAATGALLRCVPTADEALELAACAYPEDSTLQGMGPREAAQLKEGIDKKRQALEKQMQRRHKMMNLCCATFAPHACTIMSKLNASRTLNSGRINEAALCAICYMALSGNKGRERLMTAGVCELLLQTGREHSNIEAVTEWVCRVMSALCSVGIRQAATTGPSAGPDSASVLAKIKSVTRASEVSMGERGRGRLVELGAIHLVLNKFVAEHVSSWLAKQRLPMNSPARSSGQQRRGSNRKSSFTGHLLVLLEGSVTIECVCIALYSLSFQNAVYKRMVLSAQCGPVLSLYSSTEQGLLNAEDNIGGLHTIFKWVAHRCKVISALMESDIKSASRNEGADDLFDLILILPVVSVCGVGAANECPPVCSTMTWVWRLVSSLAANDSSSTCSDDDTVESRRDSAAVSTGTPFRRRSSVGSTSTSQANNTGSSSAKALLGSLDVCDALVKSLRCCGSASMELATSVCSAISAISLGHKRNQSVLVDNNACEILIQVLEYIWTEFRTDREAMLLQCSTEVDLCTEGDAMSELEERFEKLLREACIAVRALCQNCAIAAEKVLSTRFFTLLAALLQYCFELESGARPISYLWYLISGLVMNKELCAQLVERSNLCTYLSMSMKLHGANEDAAIWLATASIGIALDCDTAYQLGRAGGCLGLAQLLRLHGTSNLTVLMQCAVGIGHMAFSAPVTHNGWLGAAGVCESLCKALENVFILNLKKYAAFFTAEKLTASAEDLEENPSLYLSSQYTNAAVNAGVPIPSLEALAEAACMCIASLCAPLGQNDFVRSNENCLRLCSARVFTILSVFLKHSSVDHGAIFNSETSIRNALLAVRNISQYFVSLFQLYISPFRPMLAVEYSLMQSIICGVPRRRAVCLSIGNGGGMSESELEGALESIHFESVHGGYATALSAQRNFGFLSNRSRNPSTDSMSSYSTPKGLKSQRTVLSPLSAGEGTVRPRLLSNTSVDSTHSNSSKRSTRLFGSMFSPGEIGIDRCCNQSIGVHLKWTYEVLGQAHSLIPFHSVFNNPATGNHASRSDARKQLFEDDASGSSIVHNVIETSLSDRSAGISMVGIGDTILCHVADTLGQSIYDKQSVLIGMQAVVLLLHMRCAAIRYKIREQVNAKASTGAVNSGSASPVTHKRSGSGQSWQGNSPLVSGRSVIPSASNLETHSGSVSPMLSSSVDNDECFKRYQFNKEGVVGARVSDVVYSLLETHMNDRFIVEPMLKLLVYALTLIDADGVNYYLLHEGIMPLLLQLLNRHVDSEGIGALLCRLIINSIQSYSNIYPPFLLYHGSTDRKRDKCTYRGSGRERSLRQIPHSSQAVESGGAGAAALHTTLISQQRSDPSTASDLPAADDDGVSRRIVDSKRHAVLFGVDGCGGVELCEGLINALLQHPDSVEMVCLSFTGIAGASRPGSIVSPLLVHSVQIASDALNQNIFSSLGICEVVPRLLRAHMSNVDVVVSGCSVLHNICAENSTIRKLLVSSGDCVGVLISCLDIHKSHDVAVEWVSRAIVALSESADGATVARLGVLGVCEAVVSAMREHLENAEVALQCNYVIGNLASHSPVASSNGSFDFIDNRTNGKHNAQVFLMETSFLVSSKKLLTRHMDSPSVVAACLRAVYYVTINGSRAIELSGRGRSYSAVNTSGTASTGRHVYEDVVDLSGLQSLGNDESDDSNGEEDINDEIDADPDDAFTVPYKLNNIMRSDRSVDTKDVPNPVRGFGVDLFPLSDLISEALCRHSGVLQRQNPMDATADSTATPTGGAAKLSGDVNLLVCEWACLLICLSGNLSARCRDAYVSSCDPADSGGGVIDAVANILSLVNSISGFNTTTNIGTMGNMLSDVWSTLTSDAPTDDQPTHLSSRATARPKLDDDIPMISLEAYVNPGYGCVGYHTGALVAATDTEISLSNFDSCSEDELRKYRYELDFGRVHRVLRVACLVVHTLCSRPPVYLSTQLAFANANVCPLITKLLSKWGDKDVALCRAALKALCALSDAASSVYRDVNPFPVTMTSGVSGPSHHSLVEQVSRSAFADTEMSRDLQLYTPSAVKSDEQQPNDVIMLNNESVEVTRRDTTAFHSNDRMLEYEDEDPQGRDPSPDESIDIEGQLTSILAKLEGGSTAHGTQTTFGSGRLYERTPSMGVEEEDYIMGADHSSRSSGSSRSSLYSPDEAASNVHNGLSHSNSYNHDEFMNFDGDAPYRELEGVSALLLMAYHGTYGHCGESQDKFCDAGATKVILHLIHVYHSRMNTRLSVHLFRALESLVSHHHWGNSSKCSSSTATSSIITGMQSNLCSPGISSAGCGILSNLLSSSDKPVFRGGISPKASSANTKTCNAEVASLLGGMGACEAIIEAIDRYSGDVLLCEKAILALSYLSGDLVGMGVWLGHTGGCRALISVIKRHPNNTRIVKTGWAAVLNIARDVGCRVRFGVTGGCELAHFTLKRYRAQRQLTPHVSGSAASSSLDAEICLVSLRVICKLCHAVGGNCRRVIDDGVVLSVRDMLEEVGRNSGFADGGGVLISECAKLITSLVHYFRSNSKLGCNRGGIPGQVDKRVVNAAIDDLVVSPGTLGLLLSGLCSNVTAANICDAGCEAIAMVCCDNPLAQSEMNVTVDSSNRAGTSTSSSIHSGCDLLVNVLRHHAWMDNVCTSCCLAIHAICKGNVKNQAVMGQNGTVSLLVNFAMEHIHNERVVFCILTALESLVSLYLPNGAVCQQAGGASVLTTCLSVYVSKKHASSTLAVVLSCVKALLLSSVSAARGIIYSRDPDAGAVTRTTFLSDLVRAMSAHASIDEIGLLGCDVLALLCSYDEAEDEPVSYTLAPDSDLCDIPVACAAAGVLEVLLALLVKHGSVLGHAHYIDQFKRYTASGGSWSRNDRYDNPAGLYVSAEREDPADGEVRMLGGVYSGINYDVPLGCPEDEAYNAMFSEPNYAMSSVYVREDKDAFDYAILHLRDTLRQDTPDAGEVYVTMQSIVEANPSNSDSVEGSPAYLSPEKALAGPGGDGASGTGVLLPIDIMVVKAVSRALCQLCARTPANASKCISMGMVKALNKSITALFVSSNLCPSTECLMAKDVILASLSMSGVEADLV